MNPIGALPLDPHGTLNGLVTRRLGKKIHYFAEIDSTNSHAFRLAEEGAAEGEIVIAERQTRGKGRLGRRWISPPYLNLYFSAILRPGLPSRSAPQITLMAAVALAEAIEAFIPDRPEIKWPNDVLVHGKKIAGILAELSCAGERIDFVILGIGVNLNFPCELMPEEIREIATSMMIVKGEAVDRQTFTRRLIESLDRCYWELEEKGFSSLRLRWESFFRYRGKRVRVEMFEEALSGLARGIDADGALIVEDDAGSLARVFAGDVISMKS